MHQSSLLNNRETQARVTTIVEDSFEARPMPSGKVTLREVRRRVAIAKDTFLSLLNECGWSEQRALDHLPAFLVRGLDGLDPLPDWARRRMGDDEHVGWGAEAAGTVESERRLSALAAGNGGPTVVVPGRN